MSYGYGPSQEKQKVYVVRLTKTQLTTMRRAVVRYSDALHEEYKAEQRKKSKDGVIWGPAPDSYTCDELLSLNAVEEEV